MKKIIYTVFTLGLGASQLEAQLCTVLNTCQNVLLNDLGMFARAEQCPPICNGISTCTSTCQSINYYISQLNSFPSQSTFESILNSVCTTYAPQNTGTFENVCPRAGAEKTAPHQPEASQNTGQKIPSQRQ